MKKNNFFKNILGLLLVPMLATQVSLAAIAPSGLKTDSRIKTAMYSENEVYDLLLSYGVSALIQFEKNEIISNIIVGEPTSWSVLPLGNSLTVKPVSGNPETSMIVLTNKRAYTFFLQARELKEGNNTELKNIGREDTFMLRFVYPNSSQPIQQASRETGLVGDGEIFYPTCLNFDYNSYGDTAIAPQRVCDDGRFTYFLFDVNQNVPAIFIINENGNEAIVNTRTRGNWKVVERVYTGFSLRYDNQAAKVFNENPPLALAGGK